MWITVDVDIEEFADSIVGTVSRDNAIKLISQIDLGMQDSEFTLELLEKIVESCKSGVPQKGKDDLDKAISLTKKAFEYDED